MTDKPKTAESPDIKHPGQEEANTAFGRTGVQSPVDIGTEQAELAADKERLASLELIQERETDKSSKVSKDRKKEIDALKRKIKSKEEVIAEIVSLLQSPAKNVISALQSGANTIHGVLKTLGERPE